MKSSSNYQPSKRLQTIELLKNIFLSTNETELWREFIKFDSHIDTTSQALEADFNRYFIGPDTPLSAPYASVYIEKSESIMSKSTEQVRKIYDLMGLINPKKNSQPDDFIGLELDAYFQLLYIKEVKEIDYLEEMRVYFLNEHIAKWIFDFCNLIMQNKNNPSLAIQYLANELQLFFKNEIQKEGVCA